MQEAIQTVVSCVTPAEVLITGHQPPGPHSLSFSPHDTPVRLHGTGLPRVSLAINHRYVIEQAHDRGESWLASVIGYEYQLFAESKALLAFHWHPYGRSAVVDPHVHVSADAGWINLKKLHIPTGPVARAAAVRCAITELGVLPLRPDWPRRARRGCRRIGIPAAMATARACGRAGLARPLVSTHMSLVGFVNMLRERMLRASACRPQAPSSVIPRLPLPGIRRPPPKPTSS